MKQSTHGQIAFCVAIGARNEHSQDARRARHLIPDCVVGLVWTYGGSNDTSIIAPDLPNLPPHPRVGEVKGGHEMTWPEAFVVTFPLLASVLIVLALVWAGKE